MLCPMLLLARSSARSARAIHPRQAAVLNQVADCGVPVLVHLDHTDRFGLRPPPPTPHGTAAPASSDGMVSVSRAARPNWWPVPSTTANPITVAQRQSAVASSSTIAQPSERTSPSRQHRMNGADRLTTACPGQTPPLACGSSSTTQPPAKAGQLLMRAAAAGMHRHQTEEHAVSNVIAGPCRPNIVRDRLTPRTVVEAGNHIWTGRPPAVVVVPGSPRGSAQ